MFRAAFIGGPKDKTYRDWPGSPPQSIEIPAVNHDTKLVDQTSADFSPAKTVKYRQFYYIITDEGLVVAFYSSLINSETFSKILRSYFGETNDGGQVKHSVDGVHGESPEVQES